MKAIIAGCGQYGQVYLSYLRNDTDWEIAGFVDDDPARAGQQVIGLPVLGSSADLTRLRDQGIEAVFAPIGNNRARVRILEAARAAGLLTPCFLHSASSVSPDALVGAGVYALPGVVVMPYVQLDDYVMLDIGVQVAHHTRLRRGVFVSLGTSVGARLDVGECAFVGMGSTLMTGVSSVGADCVVGAGAVVIRDVAPGATVVGVPAKPIVRSPQPPGTPDRHG